MIRLSDLPPHLQALAREKMGQVPGSRPAARPSAPALPLVITVPMPPSPTNASGRSRHWRSLHAEKVKYWKQCDLLVASKRIPPPPDAPWPRATLTSVMFVGASNDTDNAMARHKWAIDWLRTRGYIADDRRDVLQWTGFPEQRIKRGQDYRLELTITPTEG